MNNSNINNNNNNNYLNKYNKYRYRYLYGGREREYFLSLVIICKHEDKYIKEWVDFHLGQGFQHIFLYDNDGRDTFHKILKPYLDNNTLTLIPWLYNSDIEINGILHTIQRAAYYHALNSFSSMSDWLMIMDCDEFIYCQPDIYKGTVSDYLSYLVNNTPIPISSILISRYNFGSNGHETVPPGGVIDNYTRREVVCDYFKSLINSDYILLENTVTGVHQFQMDNTNTTTIVDSKPINNYKHKLKNKPHLTKINLALIINHYYTKSIEECHKRAMLWNGINIIRGGIRKSSDCRNRSDKANDIIDTSILKSKR